MLHRGGDAARQPRRHRQLQHVTVDAAEHGVVPEHQGSDLRPTELGHVQGDDVGPEALEGEGAVGRV